MKKSYEVRITAYVETTTFVEAEDLEQACLLAENDWAESFVVYNTDTQEYSSFSEIIGYEAKELD